MKIARIPITGKSRTLPPSLTRRFMRGTYNPEIAAAHRTKVAADALRHLIKTTYGEDAEDVLCQVRRRVSESGVLDGDVIIGLNAEAAIYAETVLQVEAGTFKVDE